MRRLAATGLVLGPLLGGTANRRPVRSLDESRSAQPIARVGPFDSKEESYRTEVFSPAITYPVPEGWQNFEDTPGTSLLVPPGQSLEGINTGTSDYVGVYSAVAAAAQPCREHPAPNVAKTPAAMARWMTRLLGADATKPRPVEVGGLRGVVLDISIADGWKKRARAEHPRWCSWSAYARAASPTP